MRTQTKITYGLRDPKSGQFLRLSISENVLNQSAGDEACTLTIKPWYAQRYEVQDIRDLMATLVDNPEWYNSSRERPQWGGFEPSKLLPTRFSVTFTYDRPGKDADPVATETAAHFMELPRRFAGPVHAVKFSADENEVAKVFGKAYEPIAAAACDHEPIWTEMMLIDTTAVAAEPGMTIETGNRNTGQIDALIPVPDFWPYSRGLTTRIDLNNPGLRVAMARINRFSFENDRTRPFLATDFVKEDSSMEPE